MCLLKKKKYAAVTVEKSPITGELVDTTELKGLDVVRRDWCTLASNAGKEILSYILSNLAPDERISKIHEKLENLAESLNSGNVPLSELAIIKQLTKAIFCTYLVIPWVDRSRGSRGSCSPRPAPASAGSEQLRCSGET